MTPTTTADADRPADTKPWRSGQAASGPVVAPRPGQDPPGHLATGWEPHRSLADGLVRRFVHAYASSFSGPAHHLGAKVVGRDRYVVCDLGRPAGYLNGVLLLQPLPYEGWQDVVRALAADLVPGGTGSVLLLSPWPTPDLTAFGWELSGHPPLLLRTSGEPEPPVPGWLDVREVDDAASLSDWEHVAVEGYPFAENRPARPGTLLDERVLDDPAFHAWVGYVDGQPITIGTSYVIHGINAFSLGVTLPEHRGRGAWAVMARRRLSRFGDLPAMGLFSDHSRRPAQALGFRSLQRWTAWTRARPTTTR